MSVRAFEVGKRAGRPRTRPQNDLGKAKTRGGRCLHRLGSGPQPPSPSRGPFRPGPTSGGRRNRRLGPGPQPPSPVVLPQSVVRKWSISVSPPFSSSPRLCGRCHRPHQQSLSSVLPSLLNHLPHLLVHQPTRVSLRLLQHLRVGHGLAVLPRMLLGASSVQRLHPRHAGSNRAWVRIPRCRLPSALRHVRPHVAAHAVDVRAGHAEVLSDHRERAT